jgi:hypothetical protein
MEIFADKVEHQSRQLRLAESAGSTHRLEAANDIGHSLHGFEPASQTQ